MNNDIQFIYDQIESNMKDIYNSSGEEDRIKKIENKDIFEPIFNPYYLHDDGEINIDKYNLSQLEYMHDFMVIGNTIKLSNMYYDMMFNGALNDILESERNLYKLLEYKKDMKLYKTDNIVNIDNTNVSGDYSFYNGSFFSKSLEYNNKDIQITNVVGNGYEGNDYVITDRDQFESKYVDTRNRDNILNRDIGRPWEYSKINVTDIDDKIINNDFSHSDTLAKCIIDLQSENPISSLFISIFAEPVMLKRVEISNNGIDFEDSEIESSIINIDKVISFPSCKFIKLHFEATEYTNEIIGSSSNYKKDVRYLMEDKSTRIQKTGKRSRISISNIQAKSDFYVDKSIFRTSELIGENEIVESLAIHANELINPKFKKSYIKYKLVVNGKIKEIIPINSDKEGVKIVKSSKRTYPEERSIMIGEDIKSAFLFVEIASSNNKETPILENLKVLKY